ncbi:MAG: hypothetical protein R2877_01095 [Bdellovibrionota bacterium]
MRFSFIIPIRWMSRTVGMFEIVKAGYPDQSQYDTQSKYILSVTEEILMVPRRYPTLRKTFKHPVFLKTLRKTSENCPRWFCFKKKGRACRFSLSANLEWKAILAMSQG